MAKLGISVTTGETSGSAGLSAPSGTAFFVVASDYGPFTPQKVQSMAKYVELYGERSATHLNSYDSVESFFQLEGATAYVQRAGKESSAAYPKEELETTAEAKDAAELLETIAMDMRELERVRRNYFGEIAQACESAIALLTELEQDIQFQLNEWIEFHAPPSRYSDERTGSGAGA